MAITRLVIPRYERALLWRSECFAGVLEPGVRWIFAPFAHVGVHLYDLTVPEFEHPLLDRLLREARQTMERYFDIVELTEGEVGVVYKNGKLAGVLAPRTRQLYWKGPTQVRVEKVALSTEPQLPRSVLEDSG